jgi:cholesterol oxidase
VATPVGVFFGPDGTKTPGKTVPDPYFGGAGPERTGCIECGSCMTGCRYGAKNTLVKNYLGLAESAGAQVHPMTTVTGFKQRSDGLWEVKTAHTGRLLRRKRRTFTATHLILAAGTFGTQKLLFKMRDRGNLPKLSDKLGVLTRTNSESIVGAGRLSVRDDLDLTHGVAITSSIHPTPDTHVEPVRYGKGSNAMGLLQTLMTDGAGEGGTDTPRWRQLLDQAREDPKNMHDDRAGDAAPGQLDHHVHQAHQARLPPDGQQTGPRRTQPNLDPGGQRGHPTPRAEDRRSGGRHLG